MRKNFGSKTYLYPMPVLIIATYGNDGKPDAMNAAWGGIYDTNLIGICIDDSHKTYENIVRRKAFTVSVGDAAHVVECDYLGIVSANKEPDKLSKSGLTTEKSQFVDAPVICELPMTLECKLVKVNEDGIVVGEIVNVSADETILTNGVIDPSKFNPITYDSVNHKYLKLGEAVGNAFSDGKKLK